MSKLLLKDCVLALLHLINKIVTKNFFSLPFLFVLNTCSDHVTALFPILDFRLFVIYSISNQDLTKVIFHAFTLPLVAVMNWGS